MFIIKNFQLLYALGQEREAIMPNDQWLWRGLMKLPGKLVV